MTIETTTIIHRTSFDGEDTTIIYRTACGREARVHLQRLLVEVFSPRYSKHRFGSLDEMQRWLAARRFRAAA